MLRSLSLVAFGIAISIPSAAFSQTMTAYQTGREVAQRLGYANSDCYAKVFVKHAVVVENAAGKRGWFAASTPAYNAEQRSRCGIDWLKDSAARVAAAPVGNIAMPTAKGAYEVGLSVANKRGYTGAKAVCFANVFTTSAERFRAPDGRYGYKISGRGIETVTRELFSTCGISV